MASDSPRKKFKTGQVVCIRDGYMNAGLYIQLRGTRIGKDNREYLASKDWKSLWIAEFALRNLTRKEKGDD